MDKLLELAERCEKAAGANKMLDEAIFEALEIVPSREQSFVYPYYAYTASLDAAMTLVPEGEKFEVDGGVPNTRSRASIHAEWHRNWCTALASTPALALCAAALRARASNA